MPDEITPKQRMTEVMMMTEYQPTEEDAELITGVEKDEAGKVLPFKHPLGYLLRDMKVRMPEKLANKLTRKKIVSRDAVFEDDDDDAA